LILAPVFRRNSSIRICVTFSTMSNRSTKTQTASLVKDFMVHRLRKAGYEEWSGGNQLNFESPDAVHRAMRIMGDEFYTAYFESFEDMTGSINIHGADLKEVYFGVLDATCETGINWGRLCGLFVFSAMIAVKAMACGREDVVANIVQWATDYVEGDKYSNWINQHGGWDGFVQFHKNPKMRNAQDMDQYLWNRACTGVNYFVSGVATFANIMMH